MSSEKDSGVWGPDQGTIADGAMPAGKDIFDPTRPLFGRYPVVPEQSNPGAVSNVPDDASGSK